MVSREEQGGYRSRITMVETEEMAAASVIALGPRPRLGLTW
jgi:hypothetical protein